MSTQIPPLYVRARCAQRTELTDYRNLCAIQSALKRGDKIVALDNLDSLPAAFMNHVRVPYRPVDRKQQESYNTPWGGMYREARPKDSVKSQQVDQLIPENSWDGFRLRWIKVIGQGGFGMATLWEATFEDGSKQRIVIKIPVKVNSDFKTELSWHLRYKDASHIVQTLDLQGIADKIRARRNRYRQWLPGNRFDPSRLGVLVLEYAEHGDFFHMMSKASYFDINFSNKVLWEMWECLVKGLVSVAFQPDLASQPGRSRDLDMWLKTLEYPGNEDRFGWFRFLQNSHDVHFDLEEQNILVSVDSDHKHNPIFKLHDFGDYSHSMSKCWTEWTEHDYWAGRQTPKPNRGPPETFVSDWDDMELDNLGSVSRFTGDNFNNGNPVAGRYGTWSNVFLIGQIMEGVISKNWVSHPMRARRYESNDGNRTRRSTYGWRLTRPEYAHVEPELRDQIMQCQFERPADRPSPVSLLRTIIHRKRRGVDETPAQTGMFWKKFWSRTKQGTSQGSSAAGGRAPPQPNAGQRPAQAQGFQQRGQGNGKGKQRMAPQQPNIMDQSVVVHHDILAGPVGNADRLNAKWPAMKPPQAAARNHNHGPFAQQRPARGGQPETSSGKRRAANDNLEGEAPRKMAKRNVQA